jgi:hypothetical protein
MVKETFYKRFQKNLWFLQSWGLSRRPPPPDRRRTRAHPQQAQAGIYPGQFRRLGLFKACSAQKYILHYMKQINCFLDSSNLDLGSTKLSVPKNVLQSLSFTAKPCDKKRIKHVRSLPVSTWSDYWQSVYSAHLDEKANNPPAFCSCVPWSTMAFVPKNSLILISSESDRSIPRNLVLLLLLHHWERKLHLAFLGVTYFTCSTGI